MNKNTKQILKKQYTGKLPKKLTLAESEKFCRIIKHHKIFNHYVGSFKQDCLKLFKDNKPAFNNIIFMRKFYNINL